MAGQNDKGRGGQRATLTPPHFLLPFHSIPLFSDPRRAARGADRGADGGGRHPGHPPLSAAAADCGGPRGPRPAGAAAGGAAPVEQRGCALTTVRWRWVRKIFMK
jgi:hypothetical protein